MQFYSPEYFGFLWSIPLLIGIFWLTQLSWKRRIAKMGNQDIVLSKLMPNFDPSTKPKKIFFLILALIFSTIAMARPQWGEEKKKIQRKGIDIIFMLDTSLSMLAEDIKPSRLEKSKMEIKSILRQLRGDRVGMIAFAGSSFLQSPLTLDYAAFQLFVDAIQTGYIPDPGTSLSEALRLGIKAFPPENLKHKAIILLSDGEDLEGGVDEALDQVVKAGIRVYTLGTGLEKGDPIPLKNENGQRAGFKKDRNGQIVITKLNKAIMEKIAKETGALYFPSTPGEQEIPVILKHMDTLDKKQFKENMITEREDHYQLFLFLALLMLCLEMFVRQAKKSSKNKPGGNGAGAMATLGMIWILHSGFLESSDSLNNKASEEFKEKKYQSAVENYRKAQVKKPDDPTIRYNLGSTLYQTQNYNQAAKELETAVKNAEKSKESKELTSKALYNYGNAQYRLGNFEKAIESYQKALDLNPDDKDAKYNLEFLQNKKNAFDKKDQEQKKQDQQKQNKNQPQNQQQNQQQQQQQNQQNQEQNQQQHQQNQQQQQQNQQNQQDQQQQDEQQQNQNQQQNQDQEEQKQDQQQKEQEQQEQNQNEQQQDQQKQDQEQGDQKDQNQQQEEQNQEQEQQNQEEQKEEEKEQDQEEKPEEEEGQEQEDQQNQQPAGGGGKRPLQGQMSLNDALRILEALKDSEKDLQDLRRPPVPERPRQVAKDW